MIKAEQVKARRIAKIMADADKLEEEADERLSVTSAVNEEYVQVTLSGLYSEEALKEYIRRCKEVGGYSKVDIVSDSRAKDFGSTTFKLHF